jgi:hypothetical protein
MVPQCLRERSTNDSGKFRRTGTALPVWRSTAKRARSPRIRQAYMGI